MDFPSATNPPFGTTMAYGGPQPGLFSGTGSSAAHCSQSPYLISGNGNSSAFHSIAPVSSPFGVANFSQPQQVPVFFAYTEPAVNMNSTFGQPTILPYASAANPGAFGGFGQQSSSFEQPVATVSSLRPANPTPAHIFGENVTMMTDEAPRFQCICDPPQYDSFWTRPESTSSDSGFGPTTMCTPAFGQVQITNSYEQNPANRTMLAFSPAPSTFGGFTHEPAMRQPSTFSACAANRRNKKAKLRSPPIYGAKITTHTGFSNISSRGVCGNTTPYPAVIFQNPFRSHGGNTAFGGVCNSMQPQPAPIKQETVPKKPLPYADNVVFEVRKQVTKQGTICATNQAAQKTYFESTTKGLGILPQPNANISKGKVVYREQFVKSVFQGIDEPEPEFQPYRPRRNMKRLILEPKEALCSSSKNASKASVAAVVTSSAESIVNDVGKRESWLYQIILQKRREQNCNTNDFTTGDLVQCKNLETWRSLEVGESNSVCGARNSIASIVTSSSENHINNVEKCKSRLCQNIVHERHEENYNNCDLTPEQQVQPRSLETRRGFGMEEANSVSAPPPPILTSNAENHVNDGRKREPCLYKSILQKRQEESCNNNEQTPMELLLPKNSAACRSSETKELTSIWSPRNSFASVVSSGAESQVNNIGKRESRLCQNIVYNQREENCSNYDVTPEEQAPIRNSETWCGLGMKEAASVSDPRNSFSPIVTSNEENQANDSRKREFCPYKSILQKRHEGNCNNNEQTPAELLPPRHSTACRGFETEESVCVRAPRNSFVPVVNSNAESHVNNIGKRESRLCQSIVQIRREETGNNNELTAEKVVPPRNAETSCGFGLDEATSVPAPRNSFSPVVISSAENSLNDTVKRDSQLYRNIVYNRREDNCNNYDVAPEEQEPIRNWKTCCGLEMEEAASVPAPRNSFSPIVISNAENHVYVPAPRKSFSPIVTSNAENHVNDGRKRKPSLYKSILQKRHEENCKNYDQTPVELFPPRNSTACSALETEQSAGIRTPRNSFDPVVNSNGESNVNNIGKRESRLCQSIVKIRREENCNNNELTAEKVVPPRNAETCCGFGMEEAIRVRAPRNSFSPVVISSAENRLNDAGKRESRLYQNIVYNRREENYNNNDFTSGDLVKCNNLETWRSLEVGESNGVRAARNIIASIVTSNTENHVNGGRKREPCLYKSILQRRDEENCNNNEQIPVELLPPRNSTAYHGLETEESAGIRTSRNSFVPVVTSNAENHVNNIGRREYRLRQSIAQIRYEETCNNNELTAEKVVPPRNAETCCRYGMEEAIRVRAPRNSFSPVITSSAENRSNDAGKRESRLYQNIDYNRCEENCNNYDLTPAEQAPITNSETWCGLGMEEAASVPATRNSFSPIVTSSAENHVNDAGKHEPWPYKSILQRRDEENCNNNEQIPVELLPPRNSTVCHGLETAESTCVRAPSNSFAPFVASNAENSDSDAGRLNSWLYERILQKRREDNCNNNEQTTEEQVPPRYSENCRSSGVEEATSGRAPRSTFAPVVTSGAENRVNNSGNRDSRLYQRLLQKRQEENCINEEVPEEPPRNSEIYRGLEIEQSTCVATSNVPHIQNENMFLNRSFGGTDGPKCPTGITLQREGYYTIPSLDELKGFLAADGSCVVPNFTVGRVGYGNVYFGEEMDVAGLNLDDLVHFGHNAVHIYPDDRMKPPFGKGLNREAVVTLDNVWPQDKDTNEPIKDPEYLADMDWEGMLRMVCDNNDINFIEYRPATGSVVFRVKHF